jgi:hypothetical protein
VQPAAVMCDEARPRPRSTPAAGPAVRHGPERAVPGRTVAQRRPTAQQHPAAVGHRQRRLPAGRVADHHWTLGDRIRRRRRLAGAIVSSACRTCAGLRPSHCSTTRRLPSGTLGHQQRHDRQRRLRGTVTRRVTGAGRRQQQRLARAVPRGRHDGAGPQDLRGAGRGLAQAGRSGACSGGCSAAPTAGPGRRRPSGWPPCTPQWSTCSSGTSTWRGGRGGRAPLRHRRLRVLARHVHALLAAAGEPAAGRDALVEVLLAPLAPEVYQYQRQGRGRTPAEITGALVRLAWAVLGPPEPG